MKITKEELDKKEETLVKHLSYCKMVQSNTKEIEKELEIIRLALIGLELKAKCTMGLSVR